MTNLLNNIKKQLADAVFWSFWCLSSEKTRKNTDFDLFWHSLCYSCWKLCV